jgi:hypothetical protein
MSRSITAEYSNKIQVCLIVRVCLVCLLSSLRPVQWTDTNGKNDQESIVARTKIERISSTKLREIEKLAQISEVMELMEETHKEKLDF